MRRLFGLFLLLLIVGCGESSKHQPILVSDVPEPLMKIAGEKLPGVKFDQALKRADGIYEITGKDEHGKVREIELTGAGEVVEIE